VERDWRVCGDLRARRVERASAGVPQQGCREPQQTTNDWRTNWRTPLALN